MDAWVYVVIAVGAVLLLVVVLVFNRMIRLRNKVKRAWKDIDVQLKLRHQLIPLLVSTAEGYSLHEEQTLEKVARMRAEAEAASGAKERGYRELSLAGALSEVFVLRERYPELKADTTFERLFQELVTVENHLAAARKYYNGSVRIYNTFIQSFPQLVLARLFFFRPAEYFQHEEDPAAGA
ncbi:MAG: LemA family protein [Actinobacteria bacterium]|jgi:LemA protein|nr:MAG: LemA family protein [Actinomycetota bacterium]